MRANLVVGAGILGGRCRPLTSVCSLHDGKVVRIHNYADKAEALEAAGLRD